MTFFAQRTSSVHARSAGLAEIIDSDSEVLACLGLGQVGVLCQGCERLNGDVELLVRNECPEVRGLAIGRRRKCCGLGKFLWEVHLRIALALGRFGLGHGELLLRNDLVEYMR